MRKPHKSTKTWTSKEKLDITIKCLEQLAFLRNEDVKQTAELDVRKVHGFIKKVYNPIVADFFIFEPHRAALAHQHQNLPWLPEYWAKACKIVKTPVVETVTEIKEEVETETAPSASMTLSASIDLKALASVMAPLVAAEVVKSLQIMFEQTSSTVLDANIAHRLAAKQLSKTLTPGPETSVTKRPVVLVYGLLNDQASVVDKAWGHKFDLRFKGSEKRKGLDKIVLTGCNYAIGVTNFMSHSIDGILFKHFKVNYTRITGGVTSVNTALNKISTKVGL